MPVVQSFNLPASRPELDSASKQTGRSAPARASQSAPALDVLVLDAALRQALTTARSLGRAGLRVGLAESFAEWDPALPVAAFRSRYSAANLTFPNFAIDPDTFGASILDHLDRAPVTVIVPASDGSVAALRPWRDRLELSGARLALAREEALAVANDKDRTLALGARLGIGVPRTIRIDRVEDTRAALAEVGCPAVVKPTQSWVRRRGVEKRLQTRAVIDEGEATVLVEQTLTAGAAVVVQQLVTGSREGVVVFYAHGRVHATFAYVEHRTVPVLGGAAVMRESMTAPADIRETAIALVESLDLEGYSVIEFRRDAQERPLLMEINARLSGSVELALRCGIDFPKMLWQWAVGAPIDAPPATYASGVRMRWLHGELRWLRETFAHPGRPDSLSRSRALRCFAGDFFRRSYYDGFDLRDHRPVLADLAATLSIAHREVGGTAARRPGAQPVRQPSELV